MLCLRLKFELGLISKDELIVFSVNKLLKGSDDKIIIELASLNSKSSTREFFNLLKKTIITYDDFLKCHPEILSYLKKDYVNWQDLQEKLIKYHNIVGKYLDNQDFEFWSRLKDDFNLRKEGFTGCMNMPKEMDLYIKHNSI